MFNESQEDDDVAQLFYFWCFSLLFLLFGWFCVCGVFCLFLWYWSLNLRPQYLLGKHSSPQDTTPPLS
jgi:hypothetical protein